MRSALLLACLLLTAGCAARPAPAWTVTRLYLGTSASGGPVPATDVARFLDEVVSPAFPDGFTRYEAAGQWRGAAGVEREATIVIEVVHRTGDPLGTKAREVASAYRAAFRQEAVLVTDAPLDAVEFVDR